MTVSFYISRDGDSENGFEYGHERRAAIEIAQDLYRKYAKSGKHYAALFNLVDPPADLVIISNDGIGVADLKDYTGPLNIPQDAPWSIVDAQGVTKLLTCGSHVNPLKQVEHYRRAIYSLLRSYVNKNTVDFPAWMLRDHFHCYGSVIFTSPAFEVNGDKEFKSIPWFSVQWQEDVPEWAYRLSFGGNSKLKEEHIDRLARECFKTEPWREVEGIVLESTFGYLWVIAKDGMITAHPLYQDETVIGRSPDCNIVVPGEKYTLVSREHIRITKTATEVILTDCGSTNGTWVNGKKLKDKASHKLHRSDKITLGGYAPDGDPLDGACVCTYHLMAPTPRTTIKALPDSKESQDAVTLPSVPPVKKEGD